MGDLAEAVRAFGVQKVGAERFESAMKAVNRFWELVDEELQTLALDWRKVRLYQDALPVCGIEQQIVRDLARTGNRNYLLLERLEAHGAGLMGTESPDLLLEEYRLVQRVLAASDAAGAAAIAAAQAQTGADLLVRRDMFIADRIDSTLRSGEEGILFLGMLHSVEKWLPRDISIIYPIVPPLSVLEAGSPLEL